MKFPSLIEGNFKLLPCTYLQFYIFLLKILQGAFSYWQKGIGMDIFKALSTTAVVPGPKMFWNTRVILGRVEFVLGILGVSVVVTMLTSL